MLRSLLYHMGFAGSKSPLSACGWKLAEAACFIGEASSAANQSMCDGLHLDEDKVLISVNPEGNTRGVAPKTCVLGMGASMDENDHHINGLFEEDVKAYHNGTFKLESSVSLASWTTRAGKTHKAFGGVVQKFGRMVKLPIYEKWLSMAKSSECSELIFTGPSLGDALAQVARIDVGDIDAAGRYTRTCFGKPCRYIGVSGYGPFYGQPEDLPQMANGCSAEHTSERSFSNEGDMLPAMLNFFYFGVNDLPMRDDLSNIQHPTDPSFDPTDPSPDWRRIVPQEEIREFRKLCGVRHGELRRDLVFPLAGAPHLVVHWQDVACESSIWDYYHTQSFKERETAINSGPLATLTKRQFCPMGRLFCGHMDGLDSFFMVDFLEDDVSDGRDSDGKTPSWSLPMPAGSMLGIAYYASKVPNAILQTLLDL